MKLPKVFGMPPETMVSEAARLNSMPILEMIPHIPEFQSGLSLFRLKRAWEGDKGYHKLLDSYGFELDSTPMRIAFLADSFPSDTFTNEYSESFLNRVTEVASDAAGQLVQMTGERSALDVVSKIETALNQSGGLAGGMLGSAIGGAKKAGSMIAQIPSFGKFAKSGVDLVSKVMGGARVDFPQIWKNSGFGPSYSITCRLYNPSPGSKEYTEKYIIGPIAALLCMSLPQTDDGHTYSWPFLHKIRCRGMFSLPAAYIGNVTVIKGGDQQQIAWNQRLGIVDIRIDFGGLYSSMLAGTGDDDPDKSSLESYLEVLRDSGKMEDMYKDPTSGGDSYFNINRHGSNTPPTAAGLAMAEKITNVNKNAVGSLSSGFRLTSKDYRENINTFRSGGEGGPDAPSVSSNTTQGSLTKRDKQNSPEAGGTTNVTDSEAFDSETSSRVSSGKSATADNLEDLMPNGF